MYAAVVEKRDDIHGLCTKHRVRRLWLFGSAARAEFNPDQSDIDLLVEFENLPPVERADSYFGLVADLEALFGVRVDLVERDAIRNPYFRETIEASKTVLYDAA